MPTGKLLLRDFKGVNLKHSRRRIADEEFLWTRNVYPNTPGKLETRPRMIESFPGLGWNPANYQLPDGTTLGVLGEPYCRFFEFPDELGRLRTVFVGWVNVGTNGAAKGIPNYSLAILLAEWTPTLGFSTNYRFFVPAAVRVGGPYTWPLHGFVFENALYLTLGVDPGMALLKVTGGYLDNPNMGAENVGASWQIVQQAGLTPTICAPFAGSLFIGGFPGAAASTVYNTDPMAETLPGLQRGLRVLTAFAFPVGEADDPLETAVPVSMFGGTGVLSPYLLFLKRNSAWVFSGTPAIHTDTIVPGDNKLAPLLMGEGCVSAATVATTPFGVIWCSGRNVWLLPTGGQPRAIGEKIAPYLRQLPQERTAAWNGVYDPEHRRYILSVANPGNAAWGGQVLAPSEQWWCDLRNDPENPEWWGPQDIPSSTMFFSKAAGNKLIGVAPVAIVEDPWIGWVVANVTLPNGISNGGSMSHVPPTWGGVQAGDPFFKVFSLSEEDQTFKDMKQSLYTTQWEVRFKEFDFGDPFLLKLWEAVEIEAEQIPGGDALADDAVAPYIVQFVTGNRSEQQVTDPTNLGVFALIDDQGGMILGTSEPGENLGGGGGGGIAAAYPSTERVVGRTFEPRLVSQETTDADDATIRAHWKLSTLGLIFRPIGRRPTSTGQRDV